MKNTSAAAAYKCYELVAANVLAGGRPPCWNPAGDKTNIANHLQTVWDRREIPKNRQYKVGVGGSESVMIFALWRHTVTETRSRDFSSTKIANNFKTMRDRREMPVCLYVYMSDVCLYVYLSICLYVYIYVCMYICLSACMSGCLHRCIYVCMSHCLYVCMYVCLSICRSVCLYDYMLYMPVRLSVLKSVSHSVCIFVCLYACLPVSLFVCLRPSVCLSAWLADRQTHI